MWAHWRHSSFWKSPSDDLGVVSSVASTRPGMSDPKGNIQRMLDIHIYIYIDRYIETHI